MTDVLLTGLFTLLGVVVGGSLTTVTEVLLSRARDRRTLLLAKRLVKAELTQVAKVIRAAASQSSGFPAVSEVEEILPTSAWVRYQGVLAENLSETRWDSLVGVYQMVNLYRLQMRDKGAGPADNHAAVAKSMDEVGRWLIPPARKVKESNPRV